MLKIAWVQCRGPIEFGGTVMFMILRAAHHLAQFCGVTELRCDAPEPEPRVAEAWRKSLEMRHRGIVIRCLGGGTPEAFAGVPFFAFPDYPVAVGAERRVMALNVPEIPFLTDYHEHTRLAYCCENMTVSMALEMARLSGVKTVNFSEHSGQLYCDADTYWGNRFVMNRRDPAQDRTAAYRRLAAEPEAGISHTFGVELDVDRTPEVIDVHGAGVNGTRLGAVHFLETGDFEEKKRDFMRRVDALLAHGINILAHPFRVFAKSGLPIPEDLFRPLAEKLVSHHVAAEINFHTNTPQPEFVLEVIRRGGRVSFGTDAHNLYEAGYVLPHYEFMKSLDLAGRLDEVLMCLKK